MNQGEKIEQNLFLWGKKLMGINRHISTVLKKTLFCFSVPFQFLRFSSSLVRDNVRVVEEQFKQTSTSQLVRYTV